MSDLIPIEVKINAKTTILLFTLILECNDDEANEDVNHKESNNDDVDHVEDGHGQAMVVNRAKVLTLRVH